MSSQAQTMWNQAEESVRFWQDTDTIVSPADFDAWLISRRRGLGGRRGEVW